MNKYTVIGLCIILAFSLIGTWAAGNEEANNVPWSDLDGHWDGLLDLNGQSLRVGLIIESTIGGIPTVTLVVPEQGLLLPADGSMVKNDEIELSFTPIHSVYTGRINRDSDTIDGVWQQSGLNLPLVLSPTQEPLIPSRPQEPVPPYPYQAIEVYFNNSQAGITLAGTLTMPEGEGPHPAVVLITGSGPQDRDETVVGHKPFLVLADHLTRHGIAVLRHDDRGIGQSEGDFATATSFDFSTDTEAAFDYLLTHDDIDPDRIGLVGHSEGGMIAPMVAARRDEVAFLVLLAAPGESLLQVIIDQSELISRAEGMDEDFIALNRRLQTEIFQVVRTVEDDQEAAESIRAIYQSVPEEPFEQIMIEQQVQAFLSPWFRYAMRHDPSAYLQQVRVPVLAIIGELDLQVPARKNLELIEQALQEAGNQHYRTRILPGLNHLFQTAVTGSPTEYAMIAETFAPEALNEISEWIWETTSLGSR